MTPSQSPLGIIVALAARAGLELPDLFDEFDLPDGVTTGDVTSGAYVLTPTDLVAAADVLDVPVTVLTGKVPMDGHLGVSLRLGRVTEAADVPADALAYADMVLGHRAVLDSWLGPVESPLAGIPMHTSDYRLAAGQRSADRLRRVLNLSVEPITDLVGLVERLGFPVLFRMLPEGVHGLNVRDQRGGRPMRVIVVSTRGPWAMQRYTLAHELCHALYDDPGQVIVDRVDIPEVLTELRAEAFARELLVPRKGLAADVRRLGASRVADHTASLMVRWGVSRDAMLRALIDDGHATEDDVAHIRGARVDELVEQAGLWEAWTELTRDEHVESGSPLLVERAVEAYGRGLVKSWVVAELLGEDQQGTEQLLAQHGWAVAG